MKKKTRILSAVLALSLLLCLGACGGNNQQQSQAGATPTPDSGSPAPENSTPDSVPGLITATAGVLTMATNAAFPPYEFYTGTEITGIDAEIAKAIADKLGLELVIEDMEFDAIIPSITSGKADIGLAGMTVTAERLEAVNFTENYATGVQAIIVKEGSVISSVDDLFAEGAGYTIGVQRNTTGDLYTTLDLEDEGLATIDRYSRGADAVMALTTGKVDCVVIDNEPAKSFVSANDGLMILETEYIEEMYAGAMNKDNAELYEAVNAALKELIADGTVQAIIDKYITAD